MPKTGAGDFVVVGGMVVTTGAEVRIVVNGAVVSAWVTGDVRVGSGPFTVNIFWPI